MLNLETKTRTNRGRKELPWQELPIVSQVVVPVLDWFASISGGEKPMFPEDEPDAWILHDLSPDRPTLLHEMFPDFDPENPLADSSVPPKIRIKLALDALDISEPQVVAVPLATHLDTAVQIAETYRDHAEPRGKQVYINRYLGDNFTTSAREIDPRKRTTSPPRIRFTDKLPLDPQTSSTISVTNSEVLRGLLEKTLEDDPHAVARIYWDPVDSSNRRIAGIRLMGNTRPDIKNLGPSLQIEVDQNDPTSRNKQHEVKWFAQVSTEPGVTILTNQPESVPHIFGPLVSADPEIFQKLDQLQKVLGYAPGVIEYMVQDGQLAFVTDFDPDVLLKPGQRHWPHPPSLAKLSEELPSAPILPLHDGREELENYSEIIVRATEDEQGFSKRNGEIYPTPPHTRELDFFKNVVALRSNWRKNISIVRRAPSLKEIIPISSPSSN